MGERVETRRVLLRGALNGALYLIGPFIVMVALFALLDAMPVHLNDTQESIIGAGLVLLAAGGGGAGWGRALGRLAGLDDTRRLAWGGGLSYPPGFLGAGLGLAGLERILVEQRAVDLPIHVVFTLLFVPAAFVVAALGGLGLGIALRSGRAAVRMALLGGLASALAFLIVNVGLDLLGRRVGAPGAERTATMITTLLAGALAASLAGSAVLALLLARQRAAGVVPAKE